MATTQGSGGFAKTNRRVIEMTLEDLMTKRPPKIPVQVAAAIMGVTPRFLQMGLQQRRFPFGVGVEMGQWAYYINTERFIKYMTGAALETA